MLVLRIAAGHVAAYIVNVSAMQKSGCRRNIVCLGPETEKRDPTSVSLL